MELLFHPVVVILAALMAAGFVCLGAGFVLLNRKMKSLLGPLAAEENGEDAQNMNRNFVRRIHALEMRADACEPRVLNLENAARVSVQKVGFLRFNPFHDTGGDNSFSLALLDQDHNGVLISSLYTREGTRVYGKRIERGATHYPLLDEEKHVLNHALTIKSQ